MKKFLSFVALAVLAAPMQAARPDASKFDHPAKGWQSQLRHNAPLPSNWRSMGRVRGSAQNAPSVQAGTAAPAAAFSSAALASYPLEIQNIVKACNGDPKQLFDIVHNNVRFTPYFGSRKSAEVTWLTKAGNDFDQATLLITLLRAAGYTAYYEHTLAALTYAQAEAWLGVNTPAALDALTATAGYYAGLDTANGYLVVEQVWVLAQVNGVYYRLYPGYKPSTAVPAIDLAAALGYARTDLFNAGGGVETPTYVQGISEPGVSNYLATTANHLVADLRANHPNAEVDEIVGGHRIVPSTTGDLSTAFPNILINTSQIVDFTDPSTAPFQSQCYVNFVVGTLGSGGFSSILAGVTMPSASINGGKLSVTFANDGTVQVWLDDTLLDQSSAPVPAGAQLAIGFAVDHPYLDPNAGDQSRIYPIESSGYYTLTFNPGGYDNPAMFTRVQDRIAAYQRQGLPPSSPQIITEALQSLGVQWMKQTELGARLLAQHGNQVLAFNHSFVLVRQNASFSVDAVSFVTGIERNGNFAEADNNLRAFVIFSSAMEHGVIEQNYPGRHGVSTVRFMRLNNANGGKTFYATPDNYAAIQADPDFVAGWDSYTRNVYFPSLLGAGSPWSLILPQNEQQQVDSLVGGGYYQASANEVAALIYGGLLGGFSTTPGLVDPSQNPSPFFFKFGPFVIDNPFSREPIDMYSGAYLSDHSDLSLGGAGARGLQFARHYSSIAADRKNSSLGFGWTHDYQATLTVSSDTGSALGQTTPVSAASLIAATYAIYDLARVPTTAKSWVISSLAANWGLDQVLDHTVTLSAGRHNMPFTQLADGSYAPPAGVTAQLVKDSSTGLFHIDERHGCHTYFDAQNRIASFVDQDGKTLSYTYASTTGPLSSVTDCYGRSLTFTYDGSGQLVQVSDSTGRTVHFGYDASGNLTSAQDPMGNTMTYGYDAARRMTSIANPLNEIVVQNTYDDRGRVVTQTAEGDAAQTWNYAFNGVRNSETNPAGQINVHEFDAKGRETAWVDGAGGVLRKAYDGQDHLVQQTDPRGNVTRFVYDGRHNLRFTIDPRSNATTTYQSEYRYDSADQLIAAIDQAGKETDYTYDASFHLLTTKDPAGRVTAYEYYASGPAQGLVHQLTAPNGDVTAFAYDANGSLTTTTRPDGSVVTTTTNALGDVVYSSTSAAGDPSLHEVDYFYDANRRVTDVRDALNFGESYTYDARGYLVSSKDRFGNVTTFTYSPLGRRKTVTAPSGAVTTIGYDGSGRRERVTNPLNQVTRFEYDAAGRLAKTYDALNQLTQTSYDAAGNQLGVTNPRGQSYAWTYNALNQAISLTTPLGRVSSYAFDPRGLVSTATQPSGNAIAFAYYDDQRLKQTVDPAGTIAYGYDPKGRLQTVTEGTSVISRTYDPLDRVRTFTDSLGHVVQYDYNAVGALTKLTYPDGKAVTYAYDAAGRIVSATDWANRVSSFTYDASSHLAQIDLPNGTRRKFSYDSAGRLSSLRDETTAGQLISQYTLQYDSLDRIVHEDVLPAPAPYVLSPLAMSYDADDRLVKWDGHGTTVDADGNLTKAPVGGRLKRLSYDARNRLTAVARAQYTYDAENRRIGFSEGKTSTTYVHSPHAPMSELLTATTNGVATRYVYAAGVLLYEENASGAIRAYHSDYRGNTVALTDGTGAVTGRVQYGPFGEVAARTGTTDTPFLFNGREGVQTDANGLCYMRARYYSPEARRFLNADPINFGGGTNWYAYAGNNPIMRRDPSGMWFGIDDAIAAGAGALIGVAAQGVGDLISGKMSSWQSYTAAAVGGAAAGEATLYAGPVAGAAIGGAVTNATRQGLNIATGQQSTFSVTDLAVETGVSALGGKIGAEVTEGIARSLSNATKGEIGEWASYLYNKLQGAELVDEQVKKAFGTRTTADFVFSLEGELYIVESKFGNSTLTAAQRAALRTLGEDVYNVEYWGYDWVRRVGGNLGFGLAEGLYFK